MIIRAWQRLPWSFLRIYLWYPPSPRLVQIIAPPGALRQFSMVRLYQESVEVNANLLVLKAIRTIGCMDAHFAESFEIMKAGKAKHKHHLAHTFPLEKVQSSTISYLILFCTFSVVTGLPFINRGAYRNVVAESTAD